MVDIKTKERYLLEDLHLNTYQDGKTSGMWMHRYVTVCLKNSTRLRNLIKWLQAKPQRAAKLRILVIDDEADQASVNTRKMKEDLDEEEQERTAVNQLMMIYGDISQLKLCPILHISDIQPQKKEVFGLIKNASSLILAASG